MFRKAEAGFTLFELLAVLAIMALIAGIAMPRVLATIDHAKVTALEHGVSETKHLIMRLEIAEIQGKSHMITYKRTDELEDIDGDGKQDYLSKYLEVYLEKAASDPDDYENYSNFDGFENPYSRRSGVVNYDSYKGSEQFDRHAFFITDNSDCKYANIEYSKTDFVKHLQGTIIIYFNETAERIEIYYITKVGSKSALVEYLQY